MPLCVQPLSTTPRVGVEDLRYRLNTVLKYGSPFDPVRVSWYWVEGDPWPTVPSPVPLQWPSWSGYVLPRWSEYLGRLSMRCTQLSLPGPFEQGLSQYLSGGGGGPAQRERLRRLSRQLGLGVDELGTASGTRWQLGPTVAQPSPRRPLEARRSLRKAPQRV